MNYEQSLAHRFLNSYRTRKKFIDAAADEYAAALSSAVRVTAAVGDMGGSSPSPSASKMTDAADQMLAAAERVEAELADMAREIARRNEVILAVAERNSLWGDVLEMFYVEGLSGIEICHFLARDRRHPYHRSAVYRLRERALGVAYQEMTERGYGEGVSRNG